MNKGQKWHRFSGHVQRLAGKKYFYPAAAFVLPVLIMIAAGAAMEIWPFGDKAGAIIDSYHQYVPFLAELRDKLLTGESLFYSWHGGLGFNFWAVAAYYLASPLNLILLLFPSGMILEAFETLIVLKVALSALTMAYYLRCHSGKWNIAAVLFAQFYALGGFSAAYLWCMMWLDCIVWFPLVVLGAQRLIDEGDGRLYIASLGLTIFCNYYMAIMVCLFLILYFFAYRFQRARGGAKQLVKSGLHFAGASLTAGAIGAVYLLPTWFVMLYSSKGSPPSGWKLYRSFLDLFKQHFMLIEPTQLEGAPNIYCGLLVALLVVFYALAKVIPLRERLVRLSLAAFVLVSLNVNGLDYVWHGLHFPNNLPGRYSFIYIFLMVGMAYDAFRLIRLSDLRRYAAAGILATGLFALCLLFGKEEIPFYAALTTGLILAVYLLFLVLQKLDISLKKARIRIQPLQLLLILMAAELISGSVFSLCMNGSTTRSLYLEDTADMAKYREIYSSGEKPYRTELGQTKGRDDVTRYHLNGLSFFSSTCDDRLEDLCDALGFYKAGNKFTYEGATPVTDAMMAIRYVASKKGLSAYNLREIDKIGGETIYENRRDLPIGYLVNDDLTDWGIVSGDPFMIQNDFAALAAGTKEQIFTMLETPAPEISSGEFTSSEDCRWYYSHAEEGEITFHLVFPETQDVYAYFEASHCEKLVVEAYGNEVSYNDEKGHIIHIGICGGGAQVTLTLPLNEKYTSGNVKLRLAAFHEDAFEKMYDVLSESRYIVSSYDSTHIDGRIAAARDGILLFSIPCDEGWRILIDGAPADQFPVGDALTGVRLTAGEHAVKLSYVPVGFWPGLGLTATGIAAWILYSRYVRKKRAEREKEISRILEKAKISDNSAQSLSENSIYK